MAGLALRYRVRTRPRDRAARSVRPPEADNPLLAPDIPNLIVTPHIAWASRESRQRLIDDVAHTIEEWHTGNIRSQVI